LKNAVFLLLVDETASEALPWDKVSALSGLDVLDTNPYRFLHGRECAEYVSAPARNAVKY
jgi:hypothetical protein